MYANGAFKNPFADFDFSKFAGEFKFPTVNVETIVETGRKNFAAMTTAIDRRRRVDQDHRPAPGRHVPRRHGRFLQARQRRAGAPPPSRRRPPSRSTSPRRATSSPSPTPRSWPTSTPRATTEAFDDAERPRRRADRRGQGRDRQEVRPNGASRRRRKGAACKGSPFSLLLHAGHEPDHLRRLREGRHPRRHHPRRPAARGRAQARASARDRFRARDRRQEILGPAHRALHAREPGRPPGRGSGQLPAAPDRQVHVGGADARLSRRRGRGRAGRAGQACCRTAASSSKAR